MIKIDSLNDNGKGIAKLNGKIVFVNNAVPNEIVNIKIIKEKSKYIEADVSKYLKLSTLREKVSCPYYDKCGGCNIMHLNYNDQLNFKYEKVKNILRKYVKEDIDVNNIISSKNILNYRNKVTFQIDNKIGFFSEKTHDLIKIDNCLIANDLINKSIKYLNELDLINVNKIICRTFNNELMIIIETDNFNINVDCIKQIASSVYIKYKNNYTCIYGKEYLTQDLGKYKFSIYPDAFFQINIDVCNKLYTKIKEYLIESKNILDLYCGTGSIGIFASENKNATGIEINNQAIKNAIKNKELNNLKNINFICGDSGKSIKNLGSNFDSIIIDPPRNGLNKDTINNILKIAPNKIIYVSCDIMTLARDLNILKNEYKIVEITPFDMFPNTYHVECVAFLEKKQLIL